MHVTSWLPAPGPLTQLLPAKQPYLTSEPNPTLRTLPSTVRVLGNMGVMNHTAISAVIVGMGCSWTLRCVEPTMSTHCVTVACDSGHHMIQLRGSGAMLLRQLTLICWFEAAGQLWWWGAGIMWGQAGQQRREWMSTRTSTDLKVALGWSASV